MMKLHENRNSGFTLVEALAAAAILIILLGLSAVGVARWRDPLKITELDNAARAIYMAAENRAVLLQNSGAAVSLLDTSNAGITSSKVTENQDGKEETVSLCVLSDTTTADILDELLPVGVIDPTLREGHFYILYDQSTYHVFEVFYAEEPFSLPEKEEDMKTLRGSRSQRVSYYCGDTASRCLVGHYAGGLAGPIGAKHLPTPGVEVVITNGNELTLTVKYKMPDTLPADVTVTREPTVTLKYGEKEVRLLYVDKVTKIVHSPYSERLTEEGDIAGVTKPLSATYTWVLDSLEQDGGGNFTKQFKGLFSDPDAIAFGGDFTVTASLELSADGYIKSDNADDDTKNSLFAEMPEGGDPNTAYIANLRHLQNLDSGSSNAGGKTLAKQCANIDCSKYIGNSGNELVSSYEFRPIENGDLMNYDARYDETGATPPYSISNLKVTPNSAAGKSGAGLFGAVGKGLKFQGVLLINPNIVTDINNQPAGALLGYSWADPPVEFKNCQIIDAQVKAKASAGGFSGQVKAAEFTNCTAKNTTVNSESSYAGGLMGNIVNSSTFKSCQIVDAAVTSASVAGGMAGATWSGTVDFTECSVEGITVTSTGSYAGGMMGWIGNSVGKVEFFTCDVGTKESNISVSGIQAGGILGNADGNATFNECTVGKLNDNGTETVVISGKEYAGGLVGDSLFGNSFALTGCKVFNAKVAGINLDGTGVAGGLVGAAEGTKIIITGSRSHSITVNAGVYAGGLVGSVTGGALNDCKAINAKAASTAWNSASGGFAGRTNGTCLTKCWVYWENTTGMTASDYKISAVTAGGLVGSITGGGTITESFAATLVKGSTYAGGLVGDLPPENNTITIEKSYADCYIMTESDLDWSSAGGLIGLKEPPTETSPAVTLKLENVYAAGFIKIKKGTAAGLCGGWYSEKTTITNAYAAVHYTIEDRTKIYALAGSIFPTSPSDNPNHLYFLESAPNNEWLVTQYDTMRNISLGTAFQKPASSTVPYNLDKKNRTTYPFPGLKDLPHYGDWPTS